MSTGPLSIYGCWLLSNGDGAEYRRLLIEHGHLIPRVCGVWSKSLAGACELPKNHEGDHISKGDAFANHEVQKKP